MRNRLFCKLALRSPATRRFSALAICLAIHMLACAPLAAAGGDAPPWMHALVNAPLPAHDEKTDAVLLYSERIINVSSADRITKQVRMAYKILRPSGRSYGTVAVGFDSRKKITSLRAWSIPAQGKDYEVKEKEAIEVSLPMVEGSELISDVKDKILRIPESDPGSIVGWEYEVEEQPMVLQDVWGFQDETPARESHYTLRLPPGWEFKATWLNYPEAKATEISAGQWRWDLSDVKAIREEDDMPPIRGVAGHMIISFFPPGGQAANGFNGWQGMGTWYGNLARGRSDASAEIKQSVTSLTSAAATPLEKMGRLAKFVQHDIRYVAIELGIGGWQPHPAAEVFRHRYGDCKDKATLMGSMLREIGVDSYFVVINSRRGSATALTPANVGAFDHMILAIKLPDDLSAPSLMATMQHPTQGRLLFFDPTNDLTPLGQISGSLQSNFGLLVTKDGGELIELPKQPTSTNSVQRVAKLSLDAEGTLQGEVVETRIGDRAWSQRATLLSVDKESDKVKPIERMLSNSLSHFQVTKLTLVNLAVTDLPFGFIYSFQADNYAKKAGDLLLVRPRVIGIKASGVLETKEPRKHPIEFDGPARDTDEFSITMPPGYAVDDIPLPVDAEFSFASYHSKTVVKGNVIAYTRVFEVKELSVPVSKAEELKKFYRIIANDERSTVVLKPAR